MKKLLISLTIFFSSFLFINNAKAIYYDQGNGKDAIYSTTRKNIENKVGDTYTYKINNEDFNETIRLEYKEDGLYFSSNYVSNVPVFQSNDTSLVLNSAFILVFTPEYDQMIVYLFYKENMPKDVYFYDVTYKSDNKFDFFSDRILLSTSSVTRIKFMYTSNHTYSSNTSITNNAYNLLNWSVYGSNVSIRTLNGYYSDYPDAKEPTIDFTYKNNITTINDTNYITSKDVTMIVDNYDSNTQLLQYQFVKSGENLTDNWITHAFANNENTLTLNYKENGSLYTRILDIENNFEFITSNTFTFDDIDNIDITNEINPNIDNNNDENTMLYSIDIYTSNNKNYDFEIFYRDKNNYELNNISKADIDYFKFYGLKNNNDLFSWEQIIDTSFMIDYTDNNYIKTTNGFYFKASVNIPDHEYEKIKLAIVLKNAHKYEIQVNTSEQFDFNFLGDNYSRYETSLEINKLIVFSSYETQSDFIYILNNKAKVFADYYNTQNYNFESFGLIDYYKTFRNNTFNRFYYENIGYKNNKGFYLKTNNDDFNEYYFYIKPGLYFSLVRNLPDAAAAVIDENGNIVKETLKYYEYDNENYNSILDIFNIIKNNNNGVLTNKISEIWNIFKIDKKIYNFLILSIAISLIILLLKSMKS